VPPASRLSYIVETAAPKLNTGQELQDRDCTLSLLPTPQIRLEAPSFVAHGT
jgi:hypothetical protein